MPSLTHSTTGEEAKAQAKAEKRRKQLREAQNRWRANQVATDPERYREERKKRKKKAAETGPAILDFVDVKWIDDGVPLVDIDVTKALNAPFASLEKIAGLMQIVILATKGKACVAKVKVPSASMLPEPDSVKHCIEQMRRFADDALTASFMMRTELPRHCETKTTRRGNQATLTKLDGYRAQCADFMQAVGQFLDEDSLAETKTEYQTLYPANLEVKMSDYNRGLLLEAAMQKNAAVSQGAVRLSVFDVMDSPDNLLRDLIPMPGINTPMFYYRLFRGCPSVAHIEDLCMGE
jgi:hypothetical protein